MKFYDINGNVYDTIFKAFVNSVKQERRNIHNANHPDFRDDLATEDIEDIIDTSYQEQFTKEAVPETSSESEPPSEVSVGETQLVIKDAFPGGFTYTTDPGEIVKKSVSTIADLAEEAKKI